MLPLGRIRKSPRDLQTSRRGHLSGEGLPRSLPWSLLPMRLLVLERTPLAQEVLSKVSYIIAAVL